MPRPQRRPLTPARDWLDYFLALYGPTMNIINGVSGAIGNARENSRAEQGYENWKRNRETPDASPSGISPYQALVSGEGSPVQVTGKDPRLTLQSLLDLRQSVGDSQRGDRYVNDASQMYQMQMAEDAREQERLLRESQAARQTAMDEQAARNARMELFLNELGIRQKAGYEMNPEYSLAEAEEANRLGSPAWIHGGVFQKAPEKQKYTPLGTFTDRGRPMVIMFDPATGKSMATPIEGAEDPMRITTPARPRSGGRGGGSTKSREAAKRAVMELTNLLPGKDGTYSYQGERFDESGRQAALRYYQGLAGMGTQSTTGTTKRGTKF